MSPAVKRGNEGGQDANHHICEVEAGGLDVGACQAPSLDRHLVKTDDKEKIRALSLLDGRGAKVVHCGCWLRCCIDPRALSSPILVLFRYLFRHALPFFQQWLLRTRP